MPLLRNSGMTQHAIALTHPAEGALASPEKYSLATCSNAAMLETMSRTVSVHFSKSHGAPPLLKRSAPHMMSPRRAIASILRVFYQRHAYRLLFVPTF